MSLLTPTEAPRVHLEILPETAKATRVVAVEDRVRISCWADCSTPMDCDDSTSNEEVFTETHCSECAFYQEQMEHDAYGETVNGLELIGTYYTLSPCPCYHNGLDAVTFPCEEGLTFDPDEEFDSLSVMNMRYDVALKADSYIPVQDYIMQQGCLNIDGQVCLTDPYAAVNCFPDHHVCWGDNSEPG